MTWKDNFFNCWVHSRIEVNYESKTVSYCITKLSGEIAFYDKSASKVTGLEIYSYVNSVEMGIDNISITSKSGNESDDERTVYIVAEDEDIAEYIYIDGKPICIGRSDIFNTIKDLLERVEKLENN